MGTASPAISAASISFVKPPPGFDDLYRRYSDVVYRTALRVTGNDADAEDVLQSVFLRMLNSQAAVDPMFAPERYLRRAATNASIDLLRRKTWQAETEIDINRDAGVRENTSLLKERVRRALAKLSEDDAQLFVLCYLEGYSYDELAEQFRMERGTVGSRLFRIRAALQKYLSK